MEIQYYTCWFRLSGGNWYLIWISSEPEAVVVNTDGRIPVFDSELSLLSYTRAIGMEVENQEPIMHNLDAVEHWLQEPNDDIDCHECLAAWNLFSDVAYALEVKFSGDRKTPLRNKVYDKLFYGNNLYGLTPDGEYYIPDWSNEERKKLAQILREGFVIFRSKLIAMNV